MKIIDITDIEDIVLAKYEIDNNDPECEGRSDLNEFINKYCTLSDVLIIDNSMISFNYIEIFNNKYLFVSSKESSDCIIDFLKSIKYNYDNLKEYSMTDLIISKSSYFIHDNKYYKIP